MAPNELAWCQSCGAVAELREDNDGSLFCIPVDDMPLCCHMVYWNFNQLGESKLERGH